MDYHIKYIKYKKKYHELKKLYGGLNKLDFEEDDYEEDEEDERDDEEERKPEDVEKHHDCVYRETEGLLRAASHPWTPSHHAFLYGPDFKACIASLCLVKVSFFQFILLIGLFLNDCIFLFSSRPIYVALRVRYLVKEEAMLLFHTSPLRCGSPSCRLFRFVQAAIVLSCPHDSHLISSHLNI